MNERSAQEILNRCLNSTTLRLAMGSNGSGLGQTERSEQEIWNLIYVSTAGLEHLRFDG